MRLFHCFLVSLLEVDRHRAFSTFYSAVAKQRVSPRSAHLWWNRLLWSEALRERLRSDSCRESRRQLVRSYRTASTLPEEAPALAPGDEVQFGGLYLRILLGRTSLRRLKRYLAAA